MRKCGNRLDVPFGEKGGEITRRAQGRDTHALRLLKERIPLML